MFKKGDVVMITGTDSVFSNLLGAFGIVKETSNFKQTSLFHNTYCFLINYCIFFFHTILLKIFFNLQY